jgi:uracil-DNA glycosylase
MGSHPRSDRPRSNAEPDEIQRKLALLDAARMAPLSAYVRRLRKHRGGDSSVPWFDPTEAGTDARILLLFEAPGRRATAERGSGFISPDNNDATADNMWHLLRSAGVDRAREVVTWNVVPWYIGTEQRIRAFRPSDLAEARGALLELMTLLPNLRVAVLFGRAATRAWEALGVTLPAIPAPHPSPQNLSTRPARRPLILEALRSARRAAGL